MKFLIRSGLACVFAVLLFSTGYADQNPVTQNTTNLADLDARMADIIPVGDGQSQNLELGVAAATQASCTPWLKYTLDYSPSLNSVTYNGSRWVAVGAGDDIYYSDDGVDWHWRDGGTNKYYTMVRYFKTIFVAVGEDGVIVTSPDGQFWTQAGTPTSDELRALAVSSNRVVAVGRSGSVLWSSDGQNWFVGQIPTSRDIFCVEFFAGRFRLVDDDGGVYDSVDGSSWQYRTTLPDFPEYGSMLQMGVSSSTLVAVGYDVQIPSPGGAVLYTTTNGAAWSKAQPPCDTLRGVGFGAGKWVAVGDSTILESTNAINWNVVSSPLEGRIWDVAFGGDQFIAVGWEGIARQTCDPVSSCVYSISPSSADFSSSGGSGGFFVLTDTGCPWSALSNNGWITITDGSTGNDDGTVHYSVSTNSSTSSRSGTISVAGKTFTISQSGSTSCSYTISPNSKTFTSSGGAGTISVSTQSGCSWNASESLSWVSITSGSSGSGSGTVHYSVSTNSSTSSRSGAISVAGKSFLLYQSGVSGGSTENYMVAGIAHANGAGGSVWRSTLAVTNRSGSTANLTLIYRYGGSTTRSYTLQNNRIVEWNDVASSLFGQNGSTAGSIEVQSSRPVIITARTYNQGSNGTFGQFQPAADDGNKISFGETGILPQVKKTSGFRTNIGFVNLKSTSVTVRTNLFSANGGQLGSTINTTIPGNQWKQENDIFQKAGIGYCEVGYATVEVTTNGGSAWAYASVVDNGTGDPTTVPVSIQ